MRSIKPYKYQFQYRALILLYGDHKFAMIALYYLQARETPTKKSQESRW